MSYIGVTGFQNVGEVKIISDHIDKYPVGKIMFGFTSSNKRLLDPTSSGKTSPALNDLGKLVAAVSSNHLPMIHYYTSSPDTLAEEVIALFKYTGIHPHICGLQINQLWPDVSQIKRIVDFGQAAQIITLQLPAQALDEGNYQIIEKLKAYEGLITCVLIDPSGGLGVDFDVIRAAALMKLISQKFKMIPGVAGGFSAENVISRIIQIEDETRCKCCQQATLHDYCIDAQGKLREATEIKPIYPPDAPKIKKSSLSLIKTKNYIDNAINALYSN